MPRLLVLFLLLATAILGMFKNSSSQTIAFPSAEGFGRFATGGRGGKACHVNSIEAGAGSGGSCNAGGCGGSAPFSAGTVTLRDCLGGRLDAGPRTVIFRVGGVIDMGFCEACILSALDGTNHLPPYLTVAGQTAPGDGIMIRGMELSMYETHDIIIRHLRVRPGVIGSSFGAIETGYATHDVIVDHYSAGWASDDTAGGQYTSNITFQWGIVSEGIGDPPDTGDPRSKVGGGDTSFSFLHNYWAHHDWRVPSTGGGNIQIVNNVVYNTQQGVWVNPGYNGQPPAFVEFVNNYYHHGPDSDTEVKEPGLDFTGCGWSGSDCAVDHASRLYLSGNYQSRVRPDNSYPEDTFVLCQGECPTIVSSGFGFPAIPTLVSAQQARIDVLAKAGATVPRRDAIDQRAVNSLINLSGSVCATLHGGDVACFGGYPSYASGTPPTDTDGDGIPDAWETAHGLNPNNAADGPTITGDGYSNLEHYLNELAGDAGPGGLPPPSNLRLLSITNP